MFQDSGLRHSLKTFLRECHRAPVAEKSFWRTPPLLFTLNRNSFVVILDLSQGLGEGLRNFVGGAVVALNLLLGNAMIESLISWLSRLTGVTQRPWMDQSGDKTAPITRVSLAGGRVRALLRAVFLLYLLPLLVLSEAAINYDSIGGNFKLHFWDLPGVIVWSVWLSIYVRKILRPGMSISRKLESAMEIITPPRSPQVARRIIEIILPYRHADALIADLDERFPLECKKRGIPAARRWYWLQVIHSIPPVAWGFIGVLWEAVWRIGR